MASPSPTPRRFRALTAATLACAAAAVVASGGIPEDETALLVAFGMARLAAGLTPLPWRRGRIHLDAALPVIVAAATLASPATALLINSAFALYPPEIRGHARPATSLFNRAANGLSAAAAAAAASAAGAGAPLPLAAAAAAATHSVVSAALLTVAGRTLTGASWTAALRDANDPPVPVDAAAGWISGTAVAAAATAWFAAWWIPAASAVAVAAVVARVAADAAALRHARDDADRAHAHLADAAAALVDARHHERRDLARRLHDDVVQPLAAARLTLPADHDPGGVRDTLRDAANAAGDLARRADPAALRELGLTHGIRHLLAHACDTHPQLTAADDLDDAADAYATPHAAALAHLAVDETLAAAASDPAATRVAARLRLDHTPAGTPALTLRVTSDAHPPTALSRHPGLAIAHAAVAAAGGHLSVDDTPLSTTVRLPLPPNPPPETPDGDDAG